MLNTLPLTSVRLFTFAFVIGTGMLLGGCVTGQLASKRLDTEAKKFVVPPGKSVVYVFRDNTLYGAGVLEKVTVDDSFGLIGPANFLVKVVDPGTYVFIIESGTTWTLPAKVTLEAKAGQEYFIRVWATFKNATTNTVAYEFVAPEAAEKQLVEYALVEWIK